MPTPNFGITTYTASDTAALDTLLNGQATSLDSALLANIWTFGGTDAARTAMTAPKLREGIRFRTTDTDRDWYYDGSNWISAENGMFLVRPTSAFISGGGTATISADGGLEFSGVAAGVYVGVNGVFTTRFRKYLVTYDTLGSSGTLGARFTAGGSMLTGANYNYQNSILTGASPTGTTAATASSMVIHSQSSTQHIGEALIHKPALAEQTSLFVSGMSGNNPVMAAVTYPPASAVDGFCVGQSAAGQAGTMRVYGLVGV